METNKNYKIWIDERGIINAILLPEKPECDCDEIDGAGDFEGSHDKCDARFRSYEAVLSKAKQEAVPFKDQNEAQIILPSVCFGHAEGQLKRDTIWDFPIGYSVEVEEKPIPCPDGIDGCEVLHLGNQATLKKTSPPIPVNTEDEKGVDQKEELRKKFEDAIGSFRLRYSVDSDDEGISLLDKITPYGDESITRGREEVEQLADELYSDFISPLQQELASLRKAMEEKEDNMLDLIVTFNLSTSFTSVEEARHELPKLFESKKNAAKEWIAALDNYNKLKKKI